MPKLLFAWLGSGRTKRSHVGARGRFLDEAARAGLPVPPGAVLLDEFFQLALTNGLVQVSNQRVVCVDPDALHATIFESLRLPRFDRPVIISSIESDGDNRREVNLSLPSAVDTSDAQLFCRALAAAWTELEQSGTAQRDVLVLETVTAVHAGTAVCMIDAECDRISYATTPEFVGSGQDNMPPTPRTIAKLNGWRPPDGSLPPHAQRLQMLLRGVRRTMTPGNWVVGWADDGAICWLMELRQLSDTSALV